LQKTGKVNYCHVMCVNQKRIMAKKTKYFGEFLLKKGLIDKNDILVARHVQQEANKQIGQLAIKQKMLTAKKVQEILKQQKKTKRKFGEIAIDLKVLTSEQIQNLLEFQKKHNFLIGEIFTYEGKLSPAQVDQEFKEFADLQNKNEAEKATEENGV